MKKNVSFSERFKSSIRFFASLFASREFAILYCFIGTLAEIAHMYYLTYSISALTGWFRVIQAIMLSGFISSSLLYFVLISDDREITSDDEKIRIRAQKDSKRINLAINIFTFINIAINFYYYCRHLIIDSTEWQLFDFIFAILVSCLLPITIKLYANGIHVKDWITTPEPGNIEPQISYNNIDIDTLKAQVISELNEVLYDTIDKCTTDKINEIQIPNKEQIRIAFEEQSRLFLNQFENKLKILLNRNINNTTKPISNAAATSNIPTIPNDFNGNLELDNIHNIGIADINNVLDITSDRSANNYIPSSTETPPTTEIRKNGIPENTSNNEGMKNIGLSIDEYLKKHK